MLDAPDRHGRIVADLRRDDEVVALCRVGRWVRIAEPVRGFVEAAAVTPRDPLPPELAPCF